MNTQSPSNTTSNAGKLAWGKSVTTPFRDKIRRIAADLGINPDYLMACMAFESAQTFRSDIRNAAGSGAVGLIQFMPKTAGLLATTTDKLAAMGPVQQLDYVARYFAPYKGRLKNLEDVYMAILWPAAVGKPTDHVLFVKSDRNRPKLYIQNAGLDYNKDGKITKAEAAARVRALLVKGLLPHNAG